MLQTGRLLEEVTWDQYTAVVNQLEVYLIDSLSAHKLF